MGIHENAFTNIHVYCNNLILTCVGYSPRFYNELERLPRSELESLPSSDLEPLSSSELERLLNF
jgi:hypothetical protein